MSQPKHVRLVGGLLLSMIIPSMAFGLYLLGVLLGVFGAPRLLVPGRSIRLQQRLYSRRVHGVLLLAGAAALWIFSSQP